MLVTILAAIPYLQTLDFSFVADDHIYLGLANRDFWQLDWGTLWKLLVNPANPWEFLPVRDFSYWIDMKIGGDDAAVFHAGNLFWYGVSCLAVFWASSEIFYWSKPEWKEEVRWLAMLATAIFAWHPAHVEVVAWISGRKDLLAGVAAIIALGAVLRAQRSSRQVVWLAMSALCLLIACFSKGSALGVLPICIVCALASIRTAQSELRRCLMIYVQVVSGLLIFAATVHSIVGWNTGIRIENTPGFIEMIERASRILASLLRLVVFPNDLRIIHDVYAVGKWHWGVLSLACVLLVCAVWGVFRDGGARLLGISTLLILLPCFIYLQFLPFSTWSMASERFVFVPTLGGGILIAYVVGGRLNKFQAIVLLTMLLIVFVFAVFDRVADWRSENELWLREAALNPEYFNSVRQYVQILAAQGKMKEARAVTEGISRVDARSVLEMYLSAKSPEFDSDGRRFSSREVDNYMVCGRSTALLDMLNREKIKSVREKDLVYINFLRNIERDVNPDGRLMRFCHRLK